MKNVVFDYFVYFLYEYKKFHLPREFHTRKRPKSINQVIVVEIVVV